MDLIPRLPSLRRSVIHNDANDHNVVVDDAGLRVSGLLDFGDLVHSVTAQEAAVACAYAMLGRADPVAVMGRIVAGFDSTCPLTADELDALPSLILARLGASVAISALQARLAPDPYLRVSEGPAWALIDWFETMPGSALRAAVHEARRPMTADDLLARRRDRLGRSLSLSYRAPLTIVRGSGAHLYDADGRAYLDLVNNVAHVGHAHPRVVEAAARQKAILETNTRYLHPTILDYADRLVATLPAHLEVVHLVNSGSEANELALRMARAASGRRAVLALEGGYHGNTSGLVDVSPYKFDGPGGAGRPVDTFVAPLPDPYRGTHRGRTPEIGRGLCRGSWPGDRCGGRRGPTGRHVHRRGSSRGRPARWSRRPATSPPRSSAPTTPAPWSSPTRSRSASAGSVATGGASRSKVPRPTS